VNIRIAETGIEQTRRSIRGNGHRQGGATGETAGSNLADRRATTNHKSDSHRRVRLAPQHFSNP